MAWWVYQNVVITTGLAVLVLAACRLSRLGPVARHSLWMLVLVKFVTPPIVEWPWRLSDPLRLTALEITSENALPGAAALGAGSSRPARAGDSGEEPAQAGQRSSSLPNGDTEAPSISDVPSAVWVWLLGIWVAGSLCLVSVEGIRVLRLRRRMALAAPGDPAIDTRVAALAARMRIRPVRVLKLPGGGSPFIYGMGRPLLVWPAELTMAEALTDSCLDGLLVHELAHVKRRDHLVGWLELGASAVWWWNPLFWFVRAARREQAELACDAWVIATLPNGRRAYAESLLTLSTLAPKSTPAMAAGSRARNRRALERRLVMIMKGRAPLQLPAHGLLTIALLATATLPTWAGVRTQTQSSTIAIDSATTARAVVREATRGQFTIAMSIDQSAQSAPPPPPPRGVPQGVAQGVPQPPPPPPPKVVTVTRGKAERVAWLKVSPKGKGGPAPAEVEPLLQAYERDIEELYLELQRKTEARHDAFVKELQGLQDKYTKAGQLDEALAIRDYLQRGKASRLLLKSPTLKKQ